MRQRYVGPNTTLCLYYRSCGSTTPLNLRSTTPPLEPQPRLNHPNPAATPTTEVDYILFFYGIDPVLASLSNLKIAKISHCLRAQAIGHTQFGLVHRFVQRCASPKRLRVFASVAETGAKSIIRTRASARWAGKLCTVSV